jgi:hypothetical protein
MCASQPHQSAAQDRVKEDQGGYFSL